MLNRQLGIVNFVPLKSMMMDLFRGSQLALPGIASIPSMVAYIDRKWDGEAAKGNPTTPSAVFTLDVLEKEVKSGYDLVTSGKFQDALTVFTSMLHRIPLLVVDTRKEVDDVKELVEIAKEYSIALRCEIKRKECKDDLKKSAELAAYFTHCKLENVHVILGLRSAMNVFYKLKNFATCATFCRRLIELNPGPKVSPLLAKYSDSVAQWSQNARQALAQCEKSPEDAVQINYDARNPFDVDCLSFAPIYRGTKFTQCPYTGARFFPEHEGKVCPVGDLSKIGADASGLICSSTQIRT